MDDRLLCFLRFELKLVLLFLELIETRLQQVTLFLEYHLVRLSAPQLRRALLPTITLVFVLVQEKVHGGESLLLFGKGQIWLVEGWVLEVVGLEALGQHLARGLDIVIHLQRDVWFQE